MAKESAAKPKVKAAGIVKKDESRNGLAYFIPYFLFTVVIVAYSGFLYDTEGFRTHAKTFVVLQPFEVLFDTVEKYSPFHQVSCWVFINDFTIIGRQEEGWWQTFLVRLRQYKRL